MRSKTATAFILSDRNRAWRIVVSVFLIWLISNLAALGHDGDDKRPLEHEDYDKWNTITAQNISHDGQWISYVVQPGKGDSTLVIRHVASDKEFKVLRGLAARFTFDSRHLVYTIAPDPELIKKLKKEKKKPEDFPQPKLEILELETGAHSTIDRVAATAIPERAGGWVAFTLIKQADEETVSQSTTKVTETYQITPEGLKRPTPGKPEPKPKPEEPEVQAEGQAQSSQETGQQTESEPEPGQETAEDEQTKKKEKPAGKTLVLRDLNSHVERRFPHVVNFRFSKYGARLAFTTSAEQPEGDGVVVVNLTDGKSIQVAQGRGNYSQLAFSEDEKSLAFLTDRDDYEADQPNWSLYHWKYPQREAKRIAGHDSAGIPDDWRVSSTAMPVFTEDGRRLLFSTAPRRDEPPEPEEDEDAEPQAKLDIWHWQDPLLQPQQLLQAEMERRRSYRAAYDLRSKKIIQLATKDIPNVVIDPRSKSDVAVGQSPINYEKMRSWDFPPFYDSYLVDLKTGESQKVLERVRSSASLSPQGKYITWYDPDQKKWFAMSTQQRKPVDLTRGIKFPLYNELHDTPSPPRPYGRGGWLDDDAGFLIYDRWDIWQVDPSGKKKPLCITGGHGRQQQIRFRYVRLDNEQRSIDPGQPLVLSTLVHETKASGYYRLELGDQSPPQQLIRLDESVGGLRKARDANTVMLTRSTFQRFPDLWASTLKFQSLRRISRVNPQQHEYLWGTAELVRWNADDGQPLDGLLYKPDGFDPTKRYPMMVYFYERNSDNLHRHHVPAAGRSTINFSFYVSRGYLLFVPDIPYKTGQPGPSAANAVLPGVRHLIEQGFVDEQRIGMQGHSWGGYQAAYLVTQTNVFACAESGAPVSNMTSAYGGIRWGSGMSRMFQYERTQSRIGESLWEARDKYINNSPLFFVDKIATPLLILHNDQDTAVPWYQGIELFVAMRRLEKPAWMLNYNGDPHWVMGDANRKDFARRMQQFFDHYLKDEPMPKWMAEGIPAVDKGKEFGFEPAETETADP